MFRVYAVVAAFAVLGASSACSDSMSIDTFASGVWKCESSPAEAEALAASSRAPLAAIIKIDGNKFEVEYSDQGTSGETDTTSGTWKVDGVRLELDYTVEFGGGGRSSDARSITAVGPVELEDGVTIEGQMWDRVNQPLELIRLRIESPDAVELVNEKNEALARCERQ